MKVMIRIGVSVLIVFSFTVGLCYGQSTAWQYLTKGVDYADQGKFKEAKEEFEKALKVDPFYYSAKRVLKVIEDVTDHKIESEPAIHFFKGEAYVMKRQNDEAIAEYNKAIEINPRFVEAYNSRGAVYLKKFQFDLAISDFSKAIEINPKDAEAYHNRGTTYHVKFQHDQAISDYSKVIEINPRSANAYDNRGAAYLFSGQLDKAISDYNKAIEINPKDDHAYVMRGGVWRFKGDYNRACSDFQKACELGDCEKLNEAKKEGICQ
jgi:tetratricopeptide (TPR) repeat protein